MNSENEIVEKLRLYAQNEGSNENYQLIAQYVLENSKEITNMGVEELARETYMSTATILRFCKKIGFDGFSSMKIAIAKNISKFTDLEKRVEVNTPITKGMKSKEISEVFNSLYIQTIEEIYGSIDYAKMEKAAKLITDADCVNFYGEGNSLIVLQDFYLKLKKIGIMANLDVERGFQKVYRRKKQFKETAVVVSHFLLHNQTKNIISQLISKGYKVILITANTKSILCSMVDVVIEVRSVESYVKMGCFSSQLAETFVLDVLFGIAFAQDYDQNIKLINEVNGGLNEHVNPKDLLK